MEPTRNEYQIKINELEATIAQLRESVEKKNKELEKYQNLSTRYRRLKKMSSGYKRDRVILLVFSLLLICVLCYMGIKINEAKIQQENVQKMYKIKNGEGPNQDIYTDPL